MCEQLMNRTLLARPPSFHTAARSVKAQSLYGSLLRAPIQIPELLTAQGTVQGPSAAMLRWVGISNSP
jgi:hypothetical protein